MNIIENNNWGALFTFQKALNPLEVWKHRVPYAVTISRVKDAIIASSLQRGVQGERVQVVAPLEKRAPTVPSASVDRNS